MGNGFSEAANIQERIDHAAALHDWISLVPLFEYIHSDLWGGDHRLILILLDPVSIPRAVKFCHFRMEQWWFLEDSCVDTIMDAGLNGITMVAHSLWLTWLVRDVFEAMGEE